VFCLTPTPRFGQGTFPNTVMGMGGVGLTPTSRRAGTGIRSRILRPLLPGSYANHTFDDETVFMGIIGYIVSLLIVGFAIGGLGRLIVPVRIRSVPGGPWASVSSAPSWAAW
jgi:hypothetical protein